ncbi:hypothetical protein JCM10207_008778 [Rhodosporidiobolus poonsookiae]
MPDAALPLAGVRVLELAGLAPVPFAGLVLSDFGADVVRVDRADAAFNPDVLTRGKRSLAVSLKSVEGLAVIRKLLEPASSSSDWRADILLDPFRPGVLKRLGLDPEELLRINPRLIIASITGFRRTGPYSKSAGHDINYLAASGVLSMLGRSDDKPYAPANLLSDFAGGGLLAVVGILAALFEREKSGKGQIVEADMITGTRYAATFALLMSHKSLAAARNSLGDGLWDKPRGQNILDGGAPWYDVYECQDKGRYMSIGSIEPQFYKVFLDIFTRALPPSLVPHPPPSAANQHNRATWPALSAFLAAGFASKPRDAWAALFLGTDACCVPVLDKDEVDARGAGPFEPDRELSREDAAAGGGIPEAAPRLSRTPARAARQSEVFLEPGKDTLQVLREAGLGGETDELLKKGAVKAVQRGKAKL